MAKLENGGYKFSDTFDEVAQSKKKVFLRFQRNITYSTLLHKNCQKNTYAPGLLTSNI